jgi:uncharacterized protein (DUF488 family)
MFYRRKIILSVLDAFNGNLDKIALQKLLFLFSQRQNKKAYDFVPFKFGCYSFSAAADLSTMASKGLITEDEKSYTKKNKTNYISQLESEDKIILAELKNIYSGYSTDRITKHTYINFPYTAVNSTIANRLLTTEQLNNVELARPVGNSTILFTIGYEGISLEEYFNRLIKNNIKVLVDVRNNPLSMKYGFSKTLLQRFCNSLGINYIHYPEVGIKSDQRQELNTQKDYDKLFTSYRKNNLSKTIPAQNNILELLKQHNRIALTCFEANICQCHRKHLAESIENLPGFNYEIKHI